MGNGRNSLVIGRILPFTPYRMLLLRRRTQSIHPLPPHQTFPRLLPPYPDFGPLESLPVLSSSSASEEVLALRDQVASLQAERNQLLQTLAQQSPSLPHALASPQAQEEEHTSREVGRGTELALAVCPSQAVTITPSPEALMLERYDPRHLPRGPYRRYRSMVMVAVASA